MRTEQLFYFQQAAKYRSISVAAKQNYISQSSFSAAIAKLEKEFGAVLLRRTNTGVELTEFGEIVLEKAETIFQAQEEIAQAANTVRYSGIVTISCVPGIYYRILTKTVSELQRSNPEITLSVAMAESRDVARNVSSGYADFGILIRGEFLKGFRDLEYIPLFSDVFQLCVGEKSPLWERSEISMEEALQQPYIAYGDEFLTDKGGITALLGAKNRPNIVFRTDDLDSMKRMIATENFTAFFPKFMNEDDFYQEHGSIRALPILDMDLSFEVGYLKSRKYRLSIPDRTVLDLLEQTIQRLLRGET